MAKHVPFEIDFKIVKRLDDFSKITLVVSFIASIALFVLDYIAFENKHQVTDYINRLVCGVGIIYFLIEIASNYLFQFAEVKRRRDFFDNSLTTRLSQQNSVEYFTNDNIPAGTYKMGVNAFENSFFTKSNIAKRLPTMIFISCLILVLYIFIALYTDGEILSKVLSFVLPLTVLQQTVKLFLLKKKIDSVFESFQHIFSSATPDVKLIVWNVVIYETSLAWASIVLSMSKKEWAALNAELSPEWELLKQRYNIT